jgi:hypothetical protein
MLHVPPQHCAPCVQTSPLWRQNDEAEHTPFEQRPEQHVSLGPHALPSVLHCVLSGWQVPPLH